MSVDLPEPETPVTHTNRPTGSARSIFLRLFPRAPRSRNTRVLSKRRRVSGSGISSAPERYWPVREAGFLRISAGGPSATTRPPCSPAPGPMSSTWSAELIASSSCSTTMTVLPRSRVLERGEEARVVALVQPDRGLVEHVHHSGESRADLAGEPDSLRLAARERVRGAVERQIVEADVVEEVEPRNDLVDDFLGDGLLA